MKLNDKNIDKVFKDAAAAQDTPKFKEEYWNEMESIIDDSKSKSKLPFFLGSIAVLGILLTFGYLVTYTPDATYEQKEVLLSKNDVSHKEIQRNIKPDNTSIYNDQVSSLSLTSEKVIDNTEKESVEKVLPKNINSNIMRQEESQMTNKNDYTNHTEKTTFEEGGFNFSDKSRNEMIFESQEVKSIENSETENVLRLAPREKEITSGLVENQNLIELNNRIKPTFKFGIEGGLTFAESYQGNSASSSRFSLASIATVNWNNLIVRSGVGISHEKANNLKLRESSIVYGMNATEYENTLHYNTFTELFVPFEVGYRFNNTTFGVGGQASLLVGTKMTHNSRVNGELVDTRTLRNRQEALNTIVGGGYFWIHQHLSRNIEAGVKIGKAFGGRVYESGYDHDISKPNPVFGQIYVNFTIFEK